MMAMLKTTNHERLVCSVHGERLENTFGLVDPCISCLADARSQAASERMATNPVYVSQRHPNNWR